MHSQTPPPKISEPRTISWANPTVMSASMDEDLILETLPSRVSQPTKFLQQSKARSHAAKSGHQKARLQQATRNKAPKVPESRRTRGTLTTVYRLCPSRPHPRAHKPRNLRDAFEPENIDSQSSRDSSARWQLEGRFTASPQSFLSASSRDPFETYPVPKPTIRFGQILDYSKS